MGLDETYQRSKRSRAAVYRTLASWQSFIVVAGVQDVVRCFLSAAGGAKRTFSQSVSQPEVTFSNVQVDAETA